MSKIMPKYIKRVVLDIMALTASNYEGAEYFLTQLKKLTHLTKTTEQMKEVIAASETFVEEVGYIASSNSMNWLRGEKPSSEEQRIYSGRAHQAMEDLKQQGIIKIRLDFAVNDQSQFVRGYSSPQGDTLDAATLDKSFYAFLSANRIKSEGSIFYKIDDKDKILVDAQGNNVKADPKEVISLIKNDFPANLEKEGIELRCEEQPYPAQSKETTVDANQGIKTQSG